MNAKVLITYCWNRVRYNILRSLSAHYVNVYVVDTSKRNICSMSKYVNGSYVYPDPLQEEEAFIAKLFANIDQLQPDVLLPTHDELLVIARIIDYFSALLTIPIARYQLCSMKVGHSGSNVSIIGQSMITPLGDRADVSAMLRASDVVIMSSHREGLSLPNLEIMASGRPFSLVMCMASTRQ